MGLAAEGARVAVVTIDPAQRLAELARPRRARQRAAPRRPGALRRPRARDARRAVGDDARRQADVRRAHRAAGARRARRATRSSATASTSSSRAPSPARRSSPRSPSSTSWTARAASTSIVLDTPPSRNALDFLDAPDRLTQLLRGPRAEASSSRRRGSRRRSWAAARASSSRVLKRADRRRPARGPQRLLPRARRRCIDGFRERAEGVKALLADPATTFLDRHLARARAGRGGDLLPRQAARGRHAVRRADRQPRAPAARRRRWTPRRRRWPSSRRAARRGARGARSRGPAAEALGAGRSATPRRSSACAESSASAEPVVVPQLDGDVHDVDGLVAVHAPPVRPRDATTPPPSRA